MGPDPDGRPGGTGGRSPGGRLRVSRGLTAMRLAARGGARYAANAPRGCSPPPGSSAQQLRDDLALRTAEDVADTLGDDEGRADEARPDGQLPRRRACPTPCAARSAQLQQDAPPMSPELAARAWSSAELGAPPGARVRRVGPAADRGGVDRPGAPRRRPTTAGAVAVKVQYPGIDEAIRADLGNAGLLFRRCSGWPSPAWTSSALVEELRERIAEELDYRREADNQRVFADYYDGHPYHPRRRRSSTSCPPPGSSPPSWPTGARFAEVLTWPQERAGPGGGDDLPLRLPQPVPAARVQRRPAPGQLPVPARRAGHVPRLRPGEALHARGTRPAHPDGRCAVPATSDPDAFRARHGGGRLSSARARRSDRGGRSGTCRCSTNGPRARARGP